jgi:hypothetical protein
MKWDFPQEYKKGERKSGTAIVFNRYSLTNLTCAVSLRISFLSLNRAFWVNSVLKKYNNESSF